MFKNKDNLIISILLLIIVFIYFKKYYKQEHFEVIFSPYYPISSQVGIKVNNVEDTLDDNRLDILKKVLLDVKKKGNEGDVTYHTFNYANRPITKSMMTKIKLKPITSFIMESINTNLPNGHKLVLVKLEDMGKMEVEEEVLVNFNMICEYKISSTKNYKYARQEFKNKKDNHVVIDVEVLSIRKVDNESLHLNTLNLVGIKGEHLPGSNYYNNDAEYLFTESLSNKLIEKKKNKNDNEMKKMNNTILPDNNEEELTYNDINTEEAESFFDM
jgi:hypothetical protein